MKLMTNLISIVLFFFQLQAATTLPSSESFVPVCTPQSACEPSRIVSSQFSRTPMWILVFLRLFPSGMPSTSLKALSTITTRFLCTPTFQSSLQRCCRTSKAEGTSQPSSCSSRTSLVVLVGPWSLLVSENMDIAREGQYVSTCVFRKHLFTHLHVNIGCS